MDLTCTASLSKHPVFLRWLNELINQSIFVISLVSNPETALTQMIKKITFAVMKPFIQVFPPQSHTMSNTTPYRDQSRYAPSQWETSLYCNDVSHWLGAYLDWSQRHIILVLKHEPAIYFTMALVAGHSSPYRDEYVYHTKDGQTYRQHIDHTTCTKMASNNHGQ